MMPSTILQNRYRIVRKLGQGGMGTVYEAIDQRLSTKIALKQMLGAQDVKALNAFEREAALLANLNHPNLPKVTDHFSENDSVFLVMQFIEGMDLAEWLDLRGSAFPQSEVLQWADTLLGVLEYMHGHNPPILHRDIKPANIKRTEDGRIFLLDFGLAKGSVGQMPTYQSKQSIRGGTAHYSPLEQLSGPGTDVRSDLYSLGATLYHLVSGVVPTDARSRHQAMEDEEPDPLLTIVGSASPGVAAVIEKAMSQSRKQRFDTTVEMRRALIHAAEEDMRASLRDEYRRAEERRRQREEERKEALIQAENERQLLEAETKRQELLDQRKAVALREQELKRQRKGAREQQEKTAEVLLSAEQGANSQPAKLAVEGTFPTTRSRTRRAFAVAAIGVVIITTILVVLWKNSTAHDSTDASQTNSPAVSPLAEKQEKSESKPPAGMVYVPGGAFTMGRNDGDDYEKPAHTVIVKHFFIDIYEVTCEEYKKFLTAMPQHPAPRGWSNRDYPDGSGRRPVVGVDWYDAQAYAQWVNKRLPTEQEWELAARGTDGRLANTGRPEAAPHAGASGMLDVGTTRGKSTCGAYDMIGNAWEWTASRFEPYSSETKLNLPDSSSDVRVIRGGSWSTPTASATVTLRRWYQARGERRGYSYTGFRLVQDIPD